MPSTLYYQSFMSKHLGGVIHLLDSDDQNCSENESSPPAPSYYPVTTFRPNIQGYVGGTPRKRKTPQVCTTGKKNIRGLHIFQQEMIPNIMCIFISLLLKKKIGFIVNIFKSFYRILGILQNWTIPGISVLVIKTTWSTEGGRHHRAPQPPPRPLRKDKEHGDWNNHDHPTIVSSRLQRRRHRSVALQLPRASSSARSKGKRRHGVPAMRAEEAGRVQTWYTMQLFLTISSFEIWQICCFST